MIITRLTGGLGNQMFQYAFGRCLAHRHNTELKLDVSAYSATANSAENPVRHYDLNIFNIRENFATATEISKLSKRVEFDLADRVLNKLLGVKRGHIREPHFHFWPSALDLPDNVYLSGYWQSEKYFKEVEQILREEFIFREAPHENAVKVLEQIRNTESVCVHVRRGDFLLNPLNGLCGLEYFKAGEAIIGSRVSDAVFFVFSDDIEWCEKNLKFDRETVYVGDDFGGQKFRDDFRLMSAGKHFIISNSSFAWWAVWLSKNTNRIVVAPNEWVTDARMNTNDLYPAGWVRI